MVFLLGHWFVWFGDDVFLQMNFWLFQSFFVVVFLEVAGTVISKRQIAIYNFHPDMWSPFFFFFKCVVNFDVNFFLYGVNGYLMVEKLIQSI